MTRQNESQKCVDKFGRDSFRRGEEKQSLDGSTRVNVP